MWDDRLCHQKLVVTTQTSSSTDCEELTQQYLPQQTQRGLKKEVKAESRFMKGNSVLDDLGETPC